MQIEYIRTERVKCVKSITLLDKIKRKYSKSGPTHYEIRKGSQGEANSRS